MKSGEIAKALRYLMLQEKISVNELSTLTGIPASTLYAMLKKTTNQADLGHLKTLADFFHEDINVFCGIEEYSRPAELDPNEKSLLEAYRKVNERGQSRLLEYAAELTQNPSYTQQEQFPSFYGNFIGDWKKKNRAAKSAEESELRFERWSAERRRKKQNDPGTV